MAGIYIHVPYCKQACRYCNFHFTTQLRTVNDYTGALLREIELRKHVLSDQTVETIYVGGGTPSLLPKNALVEIKQSLENHFDLSQVKEFTVETNPDDITEELLSTLRSIGVSRLSIGVQSFFDEHLQLMNRSHSAGQATNAVKLAQDKGFQNITIDLMYALPGLSNEQWQQNLDTAAQLDIKHLSCYNLTLEERTALMHMVKNEGFVIPDDEVGAEQFQILRNWSRKNGFVHYEISNLAKLGFESKHNSAYWKGKPYVGFGPSAHSFDGNNRRHNIANTQLYTKALLTENNVPHEIEILTDAQRYNEFVMTGLRTIWGVDANVIQQKFGDDLFNHFRHELHPLMLQGLVKNNNGVITLTETGLFFADDVASRLFFVEAD